MAGIGSPLYPGSKDRCSQERQESNLKSQSSYSAVRHQNEPRLSELTGIKHFSGCSQLPEELYCKRRRLGDSGTHSGTTTRFDVKGGSDFSRVRHPDDNRSVGASGQKYEYSHRDNYQTGLLNFDKRQDASIYSKLGNQYVENTDLTRGYQSAEVIRTSFIQEKVINEKVESFSRDDDNVNESGKFDRSTFPYSKLNKDLYSSQAGAPPVASAKITSINYHSVSQTRVMPVVDLQRPTDDYDKFLRRGDSDRIPKKDDFDMLDKVPPERGRLSRDDYERMSRDKCDELPRWVDRVLSDQVVEGKQIGDYRSSRNCDDPAKYIRDPYTDNRKSSNMDVGFNSIKNIDSKDVLPSLSPPPLPPSLMGRDVSHPDILLSQALNKLNKQNFESDGNITGKFCGSGSVMDDYRKYAYEKDVQLHENKQRDVVLKNYNEKNFSKYDVSNIVSSSDGPIDNAGPIKDSDFDLERYRRSNRDDYNKIRGLPGFQDNFRQNDVSPRRENFGPQQDDFDRKRNKLIPLGDDLCIMRKDFVSRGKDFGPMRNDSDLLRDRSRSIREDFGPRRGDIGPKRNDCGLVGDVTCSKRDFGSRRDDFVLRDNDCGPIQNELYVESEGFYPRGYHFRRIDSVPKRDDLSQGRNDFASERNNFVPRRDHISTREDCYGERCNFATMRNYIDQERENYHRRDHSALIRDEIYLKRAHIDSQIEDSRLRYPCFDPVDNNGSRRTNFELMRDESGPWRGNFILRRDRCENYNDSDGPERSVKLPDANHRAPSSSRLRDGCGFGKDHFNKARSREENLDLNSAEPGTSNRLEQHFKSHNQTNKSDGLLMNLYESGFYRSPARDAYNKRILNFGNGIQPEVGIDGKLLCPPNTNFCMDSDLMASHSKDKFERQNSDRPSNKRGSFKPGFGSRKNRNVPPRGIIQPSGSGLDRGKKDIPKSLKANSEEAKVINDTSKARNENSIVTEKQKNENNLPVVTSSNSAKKVSPQILTSNSAKKVSPQIQTSNSAVCETESGNGNAPVNVKINEQTHINHSIQTPLQDSATLTLNAILNTTGPCGNNMVVFRLPGENPGNTAERSVLMLGRKCNFESYHDDKTQTWISTFTVDNRYTVATVSNTMKKRSMSLVRTIAFENLCQHYYIVKINRNFNRGPNDVDGQGNLVPVKYDRPKMQTYPVISVPDLPKIHQRIDEYATNDNLVYDLVLGFSCELQWRDRIRQYAENKYNLHVRKWGPKKCRYLVISKRYDIWTIIQGVLDKHQHFVENFEILQPGRRCE